MQTASNYGELRPSNRILMGPGPSNVHYRVYRALATPIIGHLDPEFLSLMDEISDMLRRVFETRNRLTIPISGTGSSGMEQRFERHRVLGDYLESSLLELGFSHFAQEGYRLPMLNSVILPEELDDAKTRTRLLDEYGIEVGVSLGKTKGKIWRIGLMGETCRRENIDALISALKDIVT